MLSKNFSLFELTRSDTAARLGIDNSPSEEIIERLTVLADALEFIRGKLCEPLLVTSAYRSLRLNFATPGSASGSAHVKGYAADFHVASMGAFELSCRVRDMGCAFDQIIYEYGSWCHFSADPLARGMLLTKKAGQPYEQGIIS